MSVVGVCRCFDTGIVRSVGMFEEVGMLGPPVFLSLVMGVASGMPADPDWILLLKASHAVRTLDGHMCIYLCGNCVVVRSGS